jgi:gas vesicle protein
MMKINNKKTWSFLISLMVGSLIGAGVALLMAPQSGDKTRALIRDKSIELKDKALETAESTRDRAEKTLGDVSQNTRDRANELMKRGQNMVGI